MIGIFGLKHAEKAMPVVLDGMAATLPERYTVQTGRGAGGALGIAAHAGGFGCSHVTLAGCEIVVTGAIFNLDDFAAEHPCAKSAAGLVGQWYATERLDRLANLNGQFAAAIYDRSRHRLVLITDRMGTTALHVWRRGGEVAFATQLYTLLGDARIARKANPAALAQLFTMQRTIGDTTPIEGVTALPSATIATYDGESERLDRYWRLEWTPGGFKENEGAAMLADALGRAVARQSVGRRNGLMLSGGVDSRLVLGAARPGSVSCWTTASYESNPELALARRTAELFGAEHHALIVDPANTLRILDDTVVESGGLYPASTPMSAFLPRMGEHCDVLLTGHGLDYTLRGYYLPARFAELAGSRTRLPVLRPIPKRPTGKDVLQSLRQGPPLETIERIVRPDFSDEWWRGQEDAMERVLRPWLQSDDPYNAWDGFILHSVSKHYAFTGMMSARSVGDLAIPAFDNDVLRVYLGMPPAWRVAGRLVHKAAKIISPRAARLPNANTGFRADLDPWMEMGGLMGRAALRRLGLAARPKLPSSQHSAGSWQDLNNLYKDEPGHRQRFLEIRGRVDGLTFGVMSADRLAQCIDEHLDGQAKHTKLLRQLLTHDAWVRRFGIQAHA